VEVSKNGYGVRKFAMESGLSDDSKFLSHWFGLTSGEKSLEDKMPRPSSWNYFSTETRSVNVPVMEQIISKAHSTMRRDQDTLRGFATRSGLPEDSKFLSHWFGLSKIGDNSANTDKLPRPSAWNCFVKKRTRADKIAAKLNRTTEIRTWAASSGLSEDSKFLSHWFGIADGGRAPSDDKMPRPTPWNYFAGEGDHKIAACDTDSVCVDQLSKLCAFGLRKWAVGSGLDDESQFLSHWFGLKQNARTKYTDAVGPAYRMNNWSYNFNCR